MHVLYYTINLYEHIEQFACALVSYIYMYALNTHHIDVRIFLCSGMRFFELFEV